uniref:Uncharacterized protein n=1 Tax=Rhizophora mucronata TaxID=61149 RepID=A0A2P2N0F5_RHIMU
MLMQGNALGMNPETNHHFPFQKHKLPSPQERMPTFILLIHDKCTVHKNK